MPYKNKEDQLACSRRHYKKNSNKIKLKIRQREKELSVWLKEYKKTLSCVECELSFKDRPFLCDFHHVNGEKEALISKVINVKGWGKERILKEIDKCIPLCANCHRTIHYGN